MHTLHSADQVRGPRVLDPRTAALRARLGSHLRVARARAGLSGPAAAARVGFSQSKISRIEAARLWPPLPDLIALLDVYGVAGDERARMLALAEAIAAGETTARIPQAWAGRQRHLADLDQVATAVLEFAPTVVPALLQGDEYGRAWLAAAGVVDVDQAISDRAARLTHLRKRGTPTYHVLLTEAALRWRPAAAPDCLPATWRHILDLAGDPAITVQVIADGTPTGAVPLTGWTAYRFASARPLVTVDTAAVEVTFTGDETRAFDEAWSQLLAAALDEQASARLIARLAA